MASSYRPRKRKKADCATDGRITKFFQAATPTTEAPTPEDRNGSGTSSSNTMIDPTHDCHTRHVSDHDSQSSVSGEPSHFREDLPITHWITGSYDPAHQALDVIGRFTAQVTQQCRSALQNMFVV